MAKIGDIIEGRFQIMEEIDRGGMSVVYLAMDLTLKSTWALKEVTRTGNESKYQKALREARLMSDLKFYGIPIIVDIKEIKERDVAYIAMQYIPGKSLQDIMLKQNAPFPESFVTEIGIRVSEILEYLHQQDPPVIHRDIKPANIMFVENDQSVWLLDFGEAKTLTAETLRDETPSGTRDFMPPEQRGESVGGRQISNQASDIFALGATLFYMVTGQFSSRSQNTNEYYAIHDIDSRISKSFSDVIAKAMTVSPERRYQSVTEFRNALMRCTADVINRRRIAKQKIRRFVYGLVMTVVFAGAGAGLLGYNHSRNNATFEEKLRIAKSSDGTNEEKINAALQAISLQPETLEGYDALRELYDVDNKFTIAEEKQLFGVIASHKDVLAQQPAYSDFAYNIGLMYLMSYEIESEACIKAIDWFSAVKPGNSNYSAANTYRQIGEYDKNIQKKMDAGTESGAFRTQWDNLNTALEQAAQENNELLQLRLCQKILSAITDYCYYLKKDGVTREAVHEAYLSIEDQLTQIAEVNGAEAAGDQHAIDAYVQSLDEKPSMTQRDRVFVETSELLSPALTEMQKRYGKE